MAPLLRHRMQQPRLGPRHTTPRRLPRPKRKALTNHRASGKDHSSALDVPREMTLDSALEWVAPDELVEVTPKVVRVRKAILNAIERKRGENRSLAK